MNWSKDGIPNTGKRSGYERILAKEVEGSERLNRPEKSTKIVRKRKNLVGKTNWFQTGRKDAPDPQISNRVPSG